MKSRNASWILGAACAACAWPALAQSPSNLAGAGRSFLHNDHIVSSTVFHWFTATTGQLTGPWRPMEGRENWTGEPAFWQNQIKQMMAANIDVIYVHLYDGGHDQQRKNLF